MRVRANSASGGGGGINPQVVKSVVLYKASAGVDATDTCTIDLSKDYILCGCYRYSDNYKRQEVQYIHNGTVISLTNTSGALIPLSTISGNTLTFRASGATGGVYFEFSIIQLN